VAGLRRAGAVERRSRGRRGARSGGEGAVRVRVRGVRCGALGEAEELPLVD